MIILFYLMSESWNDENEIEKERKNIYDFDERFFGYIFVVMIL